jgi:hypothetical protein
VKPVLSFLDAKAASPGISEHQGNSNFSFNLRRRYCFLPSAVGKATEARTRSCGVGLSAEVQIHDKGHYPNLAQSRSSVS